jgi:choline dehydrogenase
MSADWDYIIVGAGSAGCVLANRLSANGQNRVLLLEAGPMDRNPWIHIPVGYAKLIFNPAVGWCYETEPEPNAGGRRIAWPRGRVVGGSSSINGLIYIRGQAADYDGWAQSGNRGWSFADVLPYFRRSERQARGADDFHGTEGPLAVSDLADRHPLCEAFIAAAEETGIPRNSDFNGAAQEGAGYYQLTTRNGLRCSSAKAFLKPALKRPNLRLITGAQVESLTFEGRRVTGLRCKIGTQSHTFLARAEVILSAGTINSPQILELSGLGDAERLRAMGITPRHDLPGVGENLQDHYQVRHVMRASRPITLNDQMSTLMGRIGIGLDYIFRRRGALTISAGQVGVFARTRPDLVHPDMQIHFMTLSTDQPGKSLHDFSGFTASVCQLRPESRGHVHIHAADPMARPRIVANYLSAREDQQATVAAMRLCRQILAAPSIRDLVAAEVMPGAAIESEADLLEFARNKGGSIFHPVGTCKMGQDQLAVVDERLRVHGIGGLRVADASIMPTLISGNTNAPAIMIGEKASDMIMQDATRIA